MIQPSGRNNKLTLELQETKINALEELDKTLFERNSTRRSDMNLN